LAKKNKVVKPQHEYTRHQLSKMRKAQRRQHFILFGGIGVIVAVVLLIVAGWVNSEYIPLNKTVLQVNGVKFNTAYYIDSLKLAMASQNASSISDVSSSLISTILQDELEKQGAAKFGVTVNDSDVINLLKINNIPVSAASKDLAIASLLPDKLKSDYFNTLVPVSDNQVHMKAIMVEDENVAQTVRDRILSGDNITALAAQYAQGYFSQEYKGDFGMHSAAVLRANEIPEVPIDFAFGPDGTIGSVSQPLTDNTSYKQLGYWLIKVDDRPSDTTANVTAIYCANEPDALSVKARIDAGDNVADLADQYSQYTDVGQHGELGIMNSTNNVSDTFNGYVFNPSTKLGEWSSPLRDTYNWTKGGVWVVQVVDRQDNAKLSDDDRKTLIDKEYNDWASALMSESASGYKETLSDSLKAWAIKRATSELQSSG